MTENKGDLISREALREDLRRFFPIEVLEGIEPKTLFAQIMHDIDNFPTVCGNNPKWCESCVSKGKCASTRPQGEWQHWGSPFSDEQVINSIVCSVCGTRFVEIQDEIFNFCPNCGAKMKGGEES